MRSIQGHGHCSLGIGGALVALLTAGCFAQTEAGSSNRGSGSENGRTTVANAYIVPAFVPGRCAIQLDDGAEMRFTVSNERGGQAERFLGLSTDAAREAPRMNGVDIPPESTVGFGEPSSEAVDVGGRVPAVRLAELDPKLRPGMSTEVTFHFEVAGDVSIPVPVEACPVQVR